MWRLEREGDGRRDGAITRRESGERARAGVLAREIDRERGVLVIPANDYKKRMPRRWSLTSFCHTNQNRTPTGDCWTLRGSYYASLCSNNFEDPSFGFPIALQPTSDAGLSSHTLGQLRKASVGYPHFSMQPQYLLIHFERDYYKMRNAGDVHNRIPQVTTIGMITFDILIRTKRLNVHLFWG